MAGIENKDNNTTKINTPTIAKDVKDLPIEKKEPIKKETGEKLSKEIQELAQSLTPEKFANELESLKNKDIKGKDSLLSSMFSQLSYKGIALEQITGEKSIKLFSSDGNHSGYERALNEALESHVITMSDLQVALMYQTTSLDEFVKTNSGDKKEGLKTTKYVEFMINKYSLNEKGLKDKNGNINIGVINDNVSNLGDREFLLSFFTARASNLNVKFDDNIVQRYNQEVNDKIKLINNNIPKESLAKLGIYSDKTDKLAADFTKDPMGTMMNTVLENGGTGLLLGILMLFFGKGIKGFATGFLGGTALQTLGLDGAIEVGGKVAELTGEGVDYAKGGLPYAKKGVDYTKEGVDYTKEQLLNSKDKVIYNKIKFKVQEKKDPNFTEGDLLSKFLDFSKSDEFRALNISDLETAINTNQLAKFFEKDIKINGRSGVTYYGEKLEIEKNKIFLKYLVGEKETTDNGKTIEELFRSEDTGSSTPALSKTPEIRITQQEIINKAGVQAGVGLTSLNQLKLTSIENLENAYNSNKLGDLFKTIFRDSENKFYIKNKSDIDKLVKTMIETIPKDKKTQKVAEIIKVA